jgi:hypothetical protein
MFSFPVSDLYFRFIFNFLKNVQIFLKNSWFEKNVYAILIFFMNSIFGS